MMNRNEQLRETIPDEDFLTTDGFDEAILGYDSKNLRVVYSVSKCIDILIKQGMTEEEAFEYFYFNIEGAPSDEEIEQIIGKSLTEQKKKAENDFSYDIKQIIEKYEDKMKGDNRIEILKQLKDGEKVYRELDNGITIEKAYIRKHL